MPEHRNSQFQQTRSHPLHDDKLHAQTSRNKATRRQTHHFSLLSDRLQHSNNSLKKTLLGNKYKKIERYPIVNNRFLNLYQSSQNAFFRSEQQLEQPKGLPSMPPISNLAVRSPVLSQNQKRRDLPNLQLMQQKRQLLEARRNKQR